jgi:hypothetical protein
MPATRGVRSLSHRGYQRNGQGVYCWENAGLHPPLAGEIARNFPVDKKRYSRVVFMFNVLKL